LIVVEDFEMARAIMKLNNGLTIPSIGLGTWLGAKGQVGAAVKLALECGYKHLDCADIYRNEDEIGEFMSMVFKEGKVKREDIFVTSKLWVTDMGSKEDILDACKLTLKNLQLDYLDMYLIHLPSHLQKDIPGRFPGSPDLKKYIIGYNADNYHEAWKGMEQLVDQGLVKTIGVSNLHSKQIEDLMSREVRITPAVNQVELHPYLPQHKLAETCKKYDIMLQAFSPLGTPGRPVGEKREGDPVLLEDTVISKIATKHNCTPAQVLIAWAVERNTNCLVKSVSESRIKENLAAGEVKLDKEDMESISNIDTRCRYLSQGWGLREGQSLEDFWGGEYIN